MKQLAFVLLLFCGFSVFALETTKNHLLGSRFFNSAQYALAAVIWHSNDNEGYIYLCINTPTIDKKIIHYTLQPQSGNAPPAGSSNRNPAPQTFQATHKVETNDGSNLRLRNGQGLNAPQVGSLQNGTLVRVLETGTSMVDSDGYRGNWVYVTTSDGITGWCFNAYLQPINR